MISIISSLLKSHNHKTNLLILPHNKSNKSINKISHGFSPKLICFTSASSEYPYIRKIATYIKKTYPEIHLNIRGHHASALPDKLINDSFDSLSIGRRVPLIKT
jgi:hypothetical protein